MARTVWRPDRGNANGSVTRGQWTKTAAYLEKPQTGPFNDFHVQCHGFFSYEKMILSADWAEDRPKCQIETKRLDVESVN